MKQTPKKPSDCGIGTTQHAITVCHAALSALPLRYERTLALATVLKQLVQEGKLLGLGGVIQKTQEMINNYEHTSE